MLSPHQFCCCFFFFNYPATPEIYPFSLPDALPISSLCIGLEGCGHAKAGGTVRAQAAPPAPPAEIDVTLFLIGDAGAPAVPPDSEPVFMALRAAAASAPHAVGVFLGDNVYPSGMPDSTAPPRAAAERALTH